MARNYRRIDLAETELLAAKGLLDSVDTEVPSSAWFALGYLKGCVDNALGYLARPASKLGVEAYAAGTAVMEGYIQTALFGEGSEDGE